MAIADVNKVSWTKMWEAVDKLRDRLHRATRVLDQAEVAYAVIGGNAVASWVGSVDSSGIRNTRNVDLLIRRGDLDAVRKAAEANGFIYRHSGGIDMLLDEPNAKDRSAVHLYFADEKVRQEYELPAPSVWESKRSEEFSVLTLEALMRMKLTSNRTIDRVHVRDMIDVGLLDATWPGRFPPALANRLRTILANPDG